MRADCRFSCSTSICIARTNNLTNAYQLKYHYIVSSHCRKVTWMKKLVIVVIPQHHFVLLRCNMMIYNYIIVYLQVKICTLLFIHTRQGMLQIWQDICLKSVLHLCTLVVKYQPKMYTFLHTSCMIYTIRTLWFYTYF